MYVTNSTVMSTVQSGNTLYIGGAFTYVGPDAPYGASVDINTGVPSGAVVKPNNTVAAVAPDGSGGWYIGGSFTQVGGQTRNYIARINANGSLNAWNPNANASVAVITVGGGLVYAGRTLPASEGSQNPISQHWIPPRDWPPHEPQPQRQYIGYRCKRRPVVCGRQL